MTTKSLGITGGIGSGKSTVARLLALMGVPVYNCDVEARRLMMSDPTVRRQLIALLGPQVYTGDGALNKPLLASYLFASAEHARQVNAIVHPRVRADYRLWAARQGEMAASSPALAAATPSPALAAATSSPALAAIAPSPALTATASSPSLAAATSSPALAAAGAPTSGVRPEPVRWIGMESAILIEAGFRGEVDRLVVVTAPLELRIARAMERDGADRRAVERRIRAQISDEERCRQADCVMVNDGICGLIPQVMRILLHE